MPNKTGRSEFEKLDNILKIFKMLENVNDKKDNIEFIEDLINYLSFKISIAPGFFEPYEFLGTDEQKRQLRLNYKIEWIQKTIKWYDGKECYWQDYLNEIEEYIIKPFEKTKKRTGFETLFNPNIDCAKISGEKGSEKRKPHARG